MPQLHFVEQALTPSECLNKIRSKYGERAKVLIQRTVVKGGFFGIGGHEEVEMSGTYDYGLPASSLAAAEEMATARKNQQTVSPEEEKRKILAAAGRDLTQEKILLELKKLREQVDAKLVPPAPVENREHPSLVKLEEDLILNDFSPSYIKTMLNRARRELPFEELENYEALQRNVVRWIGEGISVYRENPGADKTPGGRKKPRIIVLVGATGVGKTTTIVKLAWLYGERSGERWRNEVRLITLDNYRIGGKEQIEKFSAILQMPVTSVVNFEGLHDVLALYRKDVDYILIDTIGKSPRDSGELGEMKTVLEACGSRAEVHLCLAASTKAGDIMDTLKQFEPFKYRSVILTKLDETSRVGNVISALSEAGKSVSFITTGQTPPFDIERASVMRFLFSLEEFSMDREELSKRFDTVETPKDTEHK